MTQYEKDIVKRIMSISGRYAPSTVFFDWVQMMACAISNSIDINTTIRDAREKRYVELMSKYDLNERNIFCEMSALLTLAMEERMGDILGDIYMSSGVYNKALGQFFTPYHVCRCMAKMTHPKELLEEYEYIKVNEPSCGGGANVIAFAEHMKEEGINYQEKMFAVCQDLDWNVVYMCYVQMSMYGIPAIVVQGNTLMNPYIGGYDEHVFRTPTYMLNYCKFRNDNKAKEIELQEEENGQMQLMLV